MMIYLLSALVILTVPTLLIAPRLGVLLAISTAALLAYEFTVARYILLMIVGLNVLVVIVLLSVAIAASLKRQGEKRRIDSTPALEMQPSSAPAEQARRNPDHE